MHGPPMIAPQQIAGWNNVVPTSYKDTNLGFCATLLINSTLQSKLNQDNVDPMSLFKQINTGRTQLWLRADRLVTVIFHSMDLPPAVVDARRPKFCVCAGIDESLTPANPPGDPTYIDIVTVVTAFAQLNQQAARLYIHSLANKKPIAGDYIEPVFTWAIHHEIASTENETSAGFSEPLGDQKSPPRWPAPLLTWKLKLL